MIGLLLIYFIGRSYYNLAGEYSKSKWGFAILGIASYYAGAFLAGIIMGIVDLVTGLNYTETLPEIVLGLIAMPFGLLFCWGLYKTLKKQWGKKPRIVASEVLDTNIFDNQ
jgi:thiamine transporter ThiT